MNLSQWRQFADRLARMDRDELRFRARQEFAKRQDAALYLLRFDFAKSGQRLDSIAKANFFFGPNDVDTRLNLLRQRLPEQAKLIVEQADKICRHRFDLLGYSTLAYGSPIDWHLDLVHAKKAPRKMFYRMRYLDFEELGDSKIIWELNRHQHLVTLAKAYRLTSDRRYADEILRQWRHWREDNPYPIGINWASSLECAFRCLAWLWTYHLLKDAPGMQNLCPNLSGECLRFLALHGRHIERYLSTYFSPNTHLLGEGVGLFFLGTLCPELLSAERWKALGWRIVLEEARRQVREDGFHFEQSTYYHVYALDLFLHASLLASANGIPLPGELEQTIEKMLAALFLLGRYGAPTCLGDDDGGRVFDPRRNRSERLLDPLAIGAVLFNRADYKAVTPLTEEAIWLLGPEGVRVWDELDSARPNMHSAALEASGIYLLSSETPATQLIVDCGPMGTQSGGHAHADALSLTLRSRHHELLIDPGSCEYVGETGDRALFRGTSMHNTLRIDGVDQAEPTGPFSWSRLVKSKAEKWIQGKSFDLLVASHDGYQRLPDPVIHRRWVFSLKNGMYFVRDRVEGLGRHHLESSWHLGPEMQLVEDGVFRAKGASGGLALILASGLGWAQEVSRQSWSQTYGEKAPATVVTFSKTADVPDESCVCLVGLEEARERPGIFNRIGESNPQSAVSLYSYIGVGFTRNEEKLSLFFGEAGKLWREGSVSSDAAFVCWIESQDEKKQQLILVDGTHAEVDKGPSVHFKRAVSWAELKITGNRREIFSSDDDAVDEKSALFLSANSPAGNLPDAPAQQTFLTGFEP
jgi:hypothetical protein